MNATEWRCHRRMFASGAAALLIAGCQSYEPAPLDIANHHELLEARSIDVESIDAFASRLRAEGAAVPAQFDIQDGLSSEEGQVLALFYNAELRQARLRAGLALATKETAGLWEDPEFGFDAAEILSPSGPFQFGLTLGLTIPISGRLEVEKDRAGAAYETELRRLVDSEWTIQGTVRAAWAAWATEDERVRLLDTVIEQVDRIRAITDRLEAAGELGRVEGRLFRVELAERQSARAQAELDAYRARLNVLSLMGLPPNADVTLTPTFPTITSLVVDDTVLRLIESNTELAVERAEYKVAEESLRLEVQKQYPDITIGSGYGSEEHDDRLLLGFSIAIPMFNANRAGIAEARIQRELARAVTESTFERLTHELAATEAILHATMKQRNGYETSVVPMLAEQSAEIERISDLGEVNTLLLLETIARQFDARSRLLDLRLAEMDAAISIMQLLGPKSDAGPAPIAGDSIEHSPTAPIEPALEGTP